MNEWILLPEGGYRVRRALLVAEDDRAVVVEDAFLEVYLDAGGRRQVRGSGSVRNAQIVELLETCETTDLMLDVDDDHRFLLKDPACSAGKVFSPKESSAIQFIPSRPWRTLTPGEFEDRRRRLQLLPE
jgi:hypothetical protein